MTLPTWEQLARAITAPASLKIPPRQRGCVLKVHYRGSVFLVHLSVHANFALARLAGTARKATHLVSLVNVYEDRRDGKSPVKCTDTLPPGYLLDIAFESKRLYVSNMGDLA